MNCPHDISDDKLRRSRSGKGCGDTLRAQGYHREVESIYELIHEDFSVRDDVVGGRR
jgi:hypothetical protein